MPIKIHGRDGEFEEVDEERLVGLFELVRELRVRPCAVAALLRTPMGQRPQAATR